MAIKKSELYSSIWESCDELRGGMDASQYKDYVLTLLFVKYVSDKYENDPYGLIEVPDGGSFDDMVALKGSKDIGDQMNKIIGRLAEANRLKGVIDLADFNDEDKLGKAKSMVDRLTNLVGIFEKLNLSGNRVTGDDLLGDAYEYLMRHFATESGKSKGQFYTPAEVSRVLAKLVGVGGATDARQTVYDPTCGSGSLLLKVADEAEGDLSLYGQEMDNATSALAKMNMILHDNPTAEIWQDNTLASPHWTEDDGELKTFDFAVANPPFSYKSWNNGLKPENDEFGRFQTHGIPPSTRGDYAFLLHIIASLKSTGRASVILPHGVLFRGNAEADIRRSVLRHGLIEGIIGLPSNLFYGTGIPACIIVLDKSRTLPTHSSNQGDMSGDNGSGRSESGVFMIDASEGYRKDGNKNRLRERDIHKIVDVFSARKEVDGYARFVPMSEIEANEYNLNIPRYIDTTKSEDIHDLEGHLKGGIPKRDIDDLSAYWDVFPNLREDLFDEAREGYVDAKVPAREVKPTILDHPDFTEFADGVEERTAAWRHAQESAMRDLGVGANPKRFIEVLSEDLLERFVDVPLVDPYAVYQRLMDFWAETMQDDVYIIAQDGWAAGRTIRNPYDGEDPDITVGRGRSKVEYVGELIPPSLIVDRYFPDEQEELERIQALQDEAQQRLDEFEEEHTGDEQVLDDLQSTQGVSKGQVQDRVLEIKREALDVLEEGTPEYEQMKSVTKSNFGTREWTHGVEDPDGFFAELDVLYDYLSLYDDVSSRKSDLKETRGELYEKVVAMYADLTMDEVKTLVVEDKWISTVEDAVRSEVERVTQQLAGRVQELEERYAQTLPQLEDDVAEKSDKVAGHLETMGVI
jgi:type I restriction enzyme M protein